MRDFDNPPAAGTRVRLLHPRPGDDGRRYPEGTEGVYEGLDNPDGRDQWHAITVSGYAHVAVRLHDLDIVQ